MDQGNLLFKLNEYYNIYFEQKIACSLFSGGGIKTYFIRNKLKQWLKNTKGTLLDIGSGDRKWEKYIREEKRYITLDYVPTAFNYPWRSCKPDINGDGLALPLRDNCVDMVLNIAVIEHIGNPAQIIKEISRVLKPGGFFVLVGPGDITLSHGEPYCFFNMTKYAYKMLLEENTFRIIEEYFPSKTFVSLAQIVYLKLVRNKIYNKNSILKCIQIPIFFVSLLVSPFVNIIGLIMDFLLPFDNRGYDVYMVLSRKIE
jgi:ubiquinone/menaquinone biosynthesis C-methylase UbiE